MLKKISFTGKDHGKVIFFAWSSIIILFSILITIIIFPVNIFNNAPDTRTAWGANGYTALTEDSDGKDGEIFKLRGEWEFYPNQLYSFDDFINGRTGEPIIVEFPHFWKNESDQVISRAGYATYRMRVRVPPSFDGIGIYSRYQNSAYEIFLNDVSICKAGVISENFSEHKPVYLPTNGYTFSSIGTEGRTFSIIVHVQNSVSDLGGLGNDVSIGSAEAVKNLRTLLLLVNGFISGGLLLLLVCFFLIYLNGRERTEYRDYTIVSLAALFISLTSGGESLMYSIGVDSVLLLRLEYCSFIIGAFFANYHILKNKFNIVFNIARIYFTAATMFFLLAPMPFISSVRIPVIAISAAFFIVPLINYIKNTVLMHDFNSITSLVSYVIVFSGICFYMFGEMPWDSIDILSVSIMVHCVLQMLMFLYRYRETEQTLKKVTETLEERIFERTIELTLMMEKAEAANIAKSNFLANMSHEIRTPMNAIMGIGDLIRTDNLDETQLNYLTDIKKSSKALLQIINDILDFSKIEAGKLEIIPAHFNLMATYDNICSMCRYSADAKNLTFKHSFAPDVPHYIFGDEIRYRQVIINILNNAIKYTKEGYVDFKVEKTEMFEIPFLTFSVKDTGIGIKQEDFPKLFISFEQLDSSSNRKILGTGLGLSITKSLVTMMNGDIQFKSEYGKGSTFTIFLPLTEGSKDGVYVQKTDLPVIAYDAKVLVVDDNEINLKVAEGFLAIHGIQPDTALSGAEAIERIKNNLYDLVFMDHMMPEMDGIKTTGIIRTIDNGRFSNLPIIALTANAVIGVTDIFKEAGMNDFLSKPIDAARINILLRRWLPVEKIVNNISAQADTGGTNDGSSGIFDELYRIEDLDVDEGISHVANNKSIYLDILRKFCNELNRYIADIMRSMDTGDWENYTIKLHAMKGVFANVGVSGLSEWAYNLEVASRNGEYSICRNETEAFCKKMELFRDELIDARLMVEDAPIEKTTIDTQELKQKLTELSNACMSGDSDLSEEIRKDLSQRSFNDEIDTELNEIYDLVCSFDFEIVADKIKDIFTRI